MGEGELILLHALRQLTPEWLTVLTKRYWVLRAIESMEPVGRRALMNQINWSERQVRGEMEALKQSGLLTVSGQGMSLSDAGRDVLLKLSDLIDMIHAIDPLEREVQQVLGVASVSVVSGDVAESPMTLHNLGRSAARCLRSRLKDNAIVAITGGTTMAAMAGAMEPTQQFSGVTVIPARGGIGQRMESQANNIAAVLAQKLGGEYHLLHLPDQLSEAARESLLSQSETREILAMLQKADMLIYGIGRADVMAERRHLPEEIQRELRRVEAVAEACGYYYNRQGEPVYTAGSVGLSLEQIDAIGTHIAVAGGAEKAQAIMAVARRKPDIHIVMDESAAGRILEIARQ
ncbi:MAG: sugar-binding transcriptional regulator [Christensenellales bacterium]